MSNLAFLRHWTQPRIQPLSMTDSEILDWQAQFVDQAVYVQGDESIASGFLLYHGDDKTKAPTLREAVCLAAAKQQIENQ